MQNSIYADTLLILLNVYYELHEEQSSSFGSDGNNKLHRTGG